ncbi:MAG TPA: hypothetical protein VKV26_00930 [Dehalococcoidia bacterium]|nr:hypothetical protein [Dehalococcoidia bacterium]
MTDEQYYRMRNEEGDVRTLADPPALLSVLRRGRRWLLDARARRLARRASGRGRSDVSGAPGSGAPAA